MAKRSYRQYCALARALDAVGERWTLLLVRELLVGPQRFTDLAAGLRGIGTNLLAARLKELEELGLVTATELAPRVPAYGLTELGQQLEEPVLALARFGRAFLGRPRGRDLWRARWSPLALQYSFDPAAAGDLEVGVEFRVEGEVFHARIARGKLAAALGPAPDAELKVATDGATVLALSRGELGAREAVRTQRMQLSGGVREFERFLRAFA